MRKEGDLTERCLHFVDEANCSAEVRNGKAGIVGLIVEFRTDQQEGFTDCGLFTRDARNRSRTPDHGLPRLESRRYSSICRSSSAIIRGSVTGSSRKTVSLSSSESWIRSSSESFNSSGKRSIITVANYQRICAGHLVTCSCARWVLVPRR